MQVHQIGHNLCFGKWKKGVSMHRLRRNLQSWKTTLAKEIDVKNYTTQHDLKNNFKLFNLQHVHYMAFSCPRSPGYAVVQTDNYLVC